MLLQRLVEYADRQDDLAPPLYSKAWVRYVIELDSGGRLLNPEPIDLSEPSSRYGQRKPVPDVARTRAIRPLLLADHAEYTFALPRDEDKPERAAEYHRAYMELLEECAVQTGVTSVTAVLRFLKNSPLLQLELPDDFDRNVRIIFRVEDQLPMRHPEVQRFWAAYHSATGKETIETECLVCGYHKPIVKRLRSQVKGIPGGHSAGVPLVSAKENAFWSYGLEHTYNAPICNDCGEQFTKAVTHLMRDENSNIVLSNLLLLFWTRREVNFRISGWLTDPDPKSVRDLINSVRTGKITSTVDETEFYAVSLNGNRGRAVIRDWIDTTVGQVKVSLARWFERQHITDEGGDDEQRPLGVFALAGATVRRSRKGERRKIPPSTARTLLRAALTDTPLPWNLLQRAIRCNLAERTVTRPRAALIKLVMISQGVVKESDMVQLQPDHPKPAYHCGRLMAVLESIQREAIGRNINTTIVDRFYGTASTAPASVFGRLIRGAQPHLSKLKGNESTRAAGHALENRLTEVVSALDTFPHTLDLKEQGLFALGYYHQRAYDRAQARATKAATDEAAPE